MASPLNFARLMAATCFAFATLASTSARSQEAGEQFAQAGGDCYSIGQRVAAENGGELARAVPITRDGQQYCLIVVLVPGREGGWPRRAEFVVPAE